MCLRKTGSTISRCLVTYNDLQVLILVTYVRSRPDTMLVEVENKKSRGVNIQAMKERNYRMVELIRQVNAREQKRLEKEEYERKTAEAEARL